MKSISTESLFEETFPFEDNIYGVSRWSIADELRYKGYLDIADRFESCHKVFFLYECPKCGFPYPLPLRCDTRFCDRCGTAKYNRYSNRLSGVFEEALLEVLKNPKLAKQYAFRRLEMGLPRTLEFGREWFDDLRECFKAFRKNYLDEKCGDVGGGFYGLEVKYANPGDVYVNSRGESYVVKEAGFNFHVHAIVLSKFIPQKVLSIQWAKATGYRACYAWVDLAKSWRAGLFETLKYQFKPPTLKKAEYYADLYEETKGMRLYSKFGVFQGYKMEDRKKVRMGCHFDGETLYRDEHSVTRAEAKEIYLNRAVPKGFLDSYVESDKLAMPRFLKVSG
jgi:hypothetical protein